MVESVEHTGGVRKVENQEVISKGQKQSPKRAEPNAKIDKHYEEKNAKTLENIPGKVKTQAIIQQTGRKE